MEVYQTDDHYIIQNGEYSLWCSRTNGTLEPKKGTELCSAWNPVCVGLVYGVIGKIKIHQDSDWRLLLISKRTCIGLLSGEHEVYQVNKVAMVTLSEADPVDLELELCDKHHFGMKQTKRITQSVDTQAKKRTYSEQNKPKKRDSKDRDKFEKRIFEELMKMYESNSFYYCRTYDITRSVQRQCVQYSQEGRPLWQQCDSRFFWNMHILQEIIETQKTIADPDLADFWIVPVIQGSVDIQECVLDFTDLGLDLSPMTLQGQGQSSKDPIKYTMTLISRRSRHRAGTRSKKRGLDETGACANYVETEQIIEFNHHRVSFVQVRGSIPVFWSQTGVKYRPPPKLDKGEAVTFEAFKCHMDEQLTLYRALTLLTLTELTGKEKVIGDAYLNNVLKYNSQDVTYVTFDFHEHCRGMKFENVSSLTSAIKDIIKHMRYCWVDRKGMICEQRGVFRVNCVDCLDRTNVVQTAVARVVMETQCRKLGLLAPEETLPDSCRRIFQQMWANTGDAISKQYAGTAALKGDFTRTGERKLTGMMKDGVNSANRYYLRFNDTYRQAAIDITHGKHVSEDIMHGKVKVPEEDVRELLEKEENVKQLIEDCKVMLILEPEECLGGWSLVNADPVHGDVDRQEMDVILLLSQRSVYVAWYDDEEEQVTQYQRIFLEDIEQLEIGAEHSLFKSKAIVMRLHYRHYADGGFFHTLKAPGTRLFNNLVIPVRTFEEAKEQLHVVAEAFTAAQNLLKLELVVEEKPKLDKRKTRPHPEVVDVHQQLQENALTGIHLPRDVSNLDIEPDSSSRGNSPRLHRKAVSNIKDDGQDKCKIRETRSEPAEGKLRREPDTSSKSAVKSLLSAIPKFGKTPSGSLELVMPQLNIKSSIVRKLKSGGVGAGRLLSKVPGAKFFNKNNSKDMADVTDADDNIVVIESVVVPENAQGNPGMFRTISKDDSSIDENQDVTEDDLKDDVVLDSCGILATNAQQIIESPNCILHTGSDNITLKPKSRFYIGLSSDSTELQRAYGQSQDEKEREQPTLLPRMQRELKLCKSESDMTKSRPEVVISKQEIDGTKKNLFPPRIVTTEPNHRLSAQARVIDDSEADRILAKYSKRSAGALTHPYMRTSLSDTAIASHVSESVEIQLENFPLPDEKSSGLELELEFNSGLQKKLPNLLQSARMSRKTHRVYESLKQHIQQSLGDDVCQSTIIFV